MVLYKCPFDGCGYVVSEPYNYCPLCGSVLGIFEDERYTGTTAYQDKDCACEMAHSCKARNFYDIDDCEKPTLRFECIQAVLGTLESLEIEFRTLRRAFEAAGLQVPPRSPDGLSVEQVLRRYKNNPES